MIEFTKSNHCLSRAHCSTCRSSPKWRASVGAPDVCPHDKGVRGLGDAVALVAQPIARMIDAATGHRTNVAGCGGCKARQAALNKAVPFA